MRLTLYLVTVYIIGVFLIGSCTKKEDDPVVSGCTSHYALNYNSQANKNCCCEYDILFKAEGLTGEKVTVLIERELIKSSHNSQGTFILWAKAKRNDDLSFTVSEAKTGVIAIIYAGRDSVPSIELARNGAQQPGEFFWVDFKLE